MRQLPLILTAMLSMSAHAQDAVDPDPALAESVEQLRYAVGDWEVVTEFLDGDGGIVRSVPGSYRFSWVIEDRVVSGISELPSLGMRSALLFYVNEREKKIEMISVGRDGFLWIMNGPLGGETRYSQSFDAADGGRGQLRFTRYDVTPDRFESRMEISTDGGNTWVPGNHQVFERRR